MNKINKTNEKISKIKLTKKTRKKIVRLLKGQDIITFKNLQESQVNHFLLKQNNITQEMLDNFVELL